MTKNEDPAIKKGSWKAFWGLLKDSKPPRWILLSAIILSILETGAGLIVPLFTKSMVDQLAASSLEMSVVLLLAGAFIIQTVSSGFSYYFLSYIGEAVVASIRRKLWGQILHLPVPFFDQQQSGETMSRVTQDTNIVKNLITQHLISFLTGIISIIGSVIILLLIDWKMTLVMIIAVPLAIAMIMPLGQKMYKISRATQDEMASFSGNLGRVLADIRLVKAYHAEKAEQESGDKGIRHLFQFGMREAKIQAVISPFMTFIMMFVLVILIGYGGVRVASGALSAGSLVAIIIYMFQIVVPFSQMASFFTAFQKAVGATERIQHIFDTEKEVDKGTEAVANPSQDITFEKVSFAYKEKEILGGASLTVPAGKTTAIVGPSGGGKTTLFALLERFYLPQTGRILLGGQDISSFRLHAWRSSIGYVSQESPIMSGTIRDNIAYGMEREVLDKEIERAAELANASEFIDALPDGFDTQVGERGIKLSGGQRQRIAIARALIRNPRILLLDEATSNLDSTSEHLVQKALEHLMEGRTTLVIAHRLSTVVDADQIAVLENGSITGTGTHRELYEKHSLYRELAEQQLSDRSAASGG
ncbi:multidrug resistance ABC transporter, ATP-binding and permease [Bacillus sp. NRRL B-14911]|uniref:Multidrug ABC transporter permease n=1 Tax=Bacillus infantis NRRL B-14911 TaxID=1367477 RepID=U5LJ36_9BACI|nr:MULTISPECIES: ABC transporter ATP-binding protein [Bacillus]AGX06681.1 multidrug ABC transporter permease [Bacillus infantis NRRL B-14911]EAR67592.1 multidrug resistance ABC transporter, ATP-binding and permease [Bacillus sp. NRRL B-14911]